jgi:DnaJ family protein A protein 5
MSQFLNQKIKPRDPSYMDEFDESKDIIIHQNDTLNLSKKEKFNDETSNFMDKEEESESKNKKNDINGNLNNITMNYNNHKNYDKSEEKIEIEESKSEEKIEIEDSKSEEKIELDDSKSEEEINNSKELKKMKLIEEEVKQGLTEKDDSKNINRNNKEKKEEINNNFSKREYMTEAKMNPKFSFLYNKKKENNISPVKQNDKNGTDIKSNLYINNPKLKFLQNSQNNKFKSQNSPTKKIDHNNFFFNLKSTQKTPKFNDDNEGKDEDENEDAEENEKETKNKNDIFENMEEDKEKIEEKNKKDEELLLSIDNYEMKDKNINDINFHSKIGYFPKLNQSSSKKVFGEKKSKAFFIKFTSNFIELYIFIIGTLK